MYDPVPLLLAPDWVEISHMVTVNCKGSWEERMYACLKLEDCLNKRTREYIDFTTSERVGAAAE